VSAPDERWLDRLPEERPPLILLLGMHRSGTTFLHQELARSSAIQSLSTHAVVAFDSLMDDRINGTEEQRRIEVASRLRPSGPDRGFDDIAVSLDAAEEYGFVLDASRPEIDNLISEPSLTDATWDRFDLLCRKLAWLAPDRGALVLKNPRDGYRDLIALAQRVPEAKLVMIHRHPIRVLASQQKAWQALCDNLNPYWQLLDARYRRVVEDRRQQMRFRMWFRSAPGRAWLAGEIAAGCHARLDLEAAVPAERLFQLRYEDLCERPAQEMERLSAFIGVPLDDPSDRISTRARPVDERTQAAWETVADQLTEYLDRWDYVA
jgi:hypothetical protein